MTPEQIKTAVEEALKNWQVFPWWAYLLLVILPACGSFFGAYLAEKAKNLATKEDIEEITKKVEAVRSIYAGQLQEREHFYNLSATSHMASVAFNKHVDFCEEYLKRSYEGVGEMFAKGPTKDTMLIAKDLAAIHRKHAPWVTADISEKLKPYEDALWKIGTNAMIEGQNVPSPKRDVSIDEMYALFSEVLGIKWKVTKDKPEARVDQILIHLQEVLGITELTRLRRAVVENAVRSIKKDERA